MKTSRLAAPLVAGALLVAGCGSETTASQAPAGRQQRPPGGGFMDAAGTKKLATALGVSETKLKAALKSAMPAGGPPDGTPPDGVGAPPNGGGAPPSGEGAPPSGGPTGARGPGGGGQLASSLARKLGLSEAEVQKALQSVRP